MLKKTCHWDPFAAKHHLHIALTLGEVHGEQKKFSLLPCHKIVGPSHFPLELSIPCALLVGFLVIEMREMRKIAEDPWCCIAPEIHDLRANPAATGRDELRRSVSSHRELQHPGASIEK